MTNQKRPMRLADFEPEKDEYVSVNKLAESGCRFNLNAFGRVSEVFCSRRFDDSISTTLENLDYLTKIVMFWFQNDRQPFTRVGLSRHAECK